MKRSNNKKTVVIETTVGDFLESVFESAYEAFHDVHFAERVASKTLKRKMRLSPRAMAHAHRNTP